MRQFLTAAFLGATLALGASAALADEKVDYVPAHQRTQSESVASQNVLQIGSREPVVAGSGSIMVYHLQRRDNREH